MDEGSKGVSSSLERGGGEGGGDVPKNHCNYSVQICKMKLIFCLFKSADPPESLWPIPHSPPSFAIYNISLFVLRIITVFTVIGSLGTHDFRAKLFFLFAIYQILFGDRPNGINCATSKLH